METDREQKSDLADWDFRSQLDTQEAFAQLVRTHQASIRWYLTRALRDLVAADDLAQEVFLHAFERIDDYRGEGTVGAWLHGIARNLAREYIRSATRRRAREQGPLQVQLALWRMERLEREPWEDAEQEQTFAALRECIERLAPNSQLVVKEHYFDRKTIEAIAHGLDRSGGSVRMMLFRIRHALGDCLRSKLTPQG